MASKFNVHKLLLPFWGLFSVHGFVFAQTAGDSGVSLQGAGVYKFCVGDVQITALSDGTVPQDLHKLLLGTTDEHTDALLKAGFLVNPIEASINAYLLKLDGRTVLIDTGSGNLFPPGFGGKLLQSLTAAGFRPDQITDVLLTHAHDDHMGGLIHNGRLVFPQATVYVGKADVKFFQDRSHSAKAHYGMNYFDDYFNSLNYYVRAGRVKMFEGTAEIIPGITATVHPGHTPGSTFYTLRSHGQSIVFVPDFAHVAAVQLPDPTISIQYDVDPDQARTVREKALSEFAQNRTLIAVPHFPFPGVGHIRRAKTGFEWMPLNYTNRLANSGTPNKPL